MKRLLVAAVFLLGLGLVAQPATAQTGAARGKVVDQAGQPVADAQVTIVMWSSSEVQVMGQTLMDYIAPAEVERLIREKVVMRPQTTECTVPAGIFKDEGSMFSFIAYGDELNLVHPPRPRVSQAVRPVLGLLLQNAPRGGVEIVRAATPARRAGLSAGDRIVKIDGQVVRTASSVDSILRGLGDGDLVRVVATRQDDVGKESIVWVDAPVQVRPDSRPPLTHLHQLRGMSSVH